MSRGYRVAQLDHVEFFVPSRREAASWYERVLGLEIVEDYEFWAADPRGPLMISTPEGGTKLALFRGEAQGTRPTAGFHRVAFRVDGPGFVQFLARLKEIPLEDHEGRPLRPTDVIDHERSYSIYFCDPFGHRLEVTTYDHDYTAQRLPVGGSETGENPG